jgi:hypothetical protein
MDRTAVPHELVALILTGIRGSEEKRLNKATGGLIRLEGAAYAGKGLAQG